MTNFETNNELGNPSDRRHQRFKVELRFRCFPPPTRSQVITSGRASDVSIGGMLAFLPADFAPGDSLKLELSFPYSEQKVLLNAIVRNRNGFTYGLEFVKPSAREEEIITRCCRALELLDE
jgi:hypothetical protein